MRVSRTEVRSVSRCCSCPWFENHPYEPSCDLKRRLSGKYSEYEGYGNLCHRDKIDDRCPIKLKRYY